MTARVFVLSSEQSYLQSRVYIAMCWQRAATDGSPLVVTITQDRLTRTAAQNARMWAMLSDIADQVDWHGNRLSADEWKDVFTAALKRQRVVPGLDGGFVVLGQSTRRMTIAEMSELIELMLAFGVERGVKFADEAKA